MTPASQSIFVEFYLVSLPNLSNPMAILFRSCLQIIIVHSCGKGLLGPWGYLSACHCTLTALSAWADSSESPKSAFHTWVKEYESPIFFQVIVLDIARMLAKYFQDFSKFLKFPKKI